jgi:hypothetical protein
LRIALIMPRGLLPWLYHRVNPDLALMGGDGLEPPTPSV